MSIPIHLKMFQKINKFQHTHLNIIKTESISNVINEKISSLNNKKLSFTYLLS